MDNILSILKAFLLGGIICLIAQILIDRTKITPAKILVSFLIAGLILSALGIYKHLESFGGAGATIPISGFGHTLAEGTMKEIKEKGIIGVLTGPFAAFGGGLSVAIITAFLISLVAKPKDKK